jgi:diguanylate cyclase (GGDEF)-like protein
VAENILFGTPVGTTFSLENLGENAYVQKVLDDVGLSRQFVEKGNRLAEIMVELFKDLPPDHEFFERFGFISSEDLPDFEAVVRRVDKNGIDGISDDDVRRLRALPFKLIKARHHLDLIDEDFEQKLLDARRRFAEELPPDYSNAVQFFHVDEYSGAATVQDNILFGKIDSSRAESSEQVGRLLAEVIEETGLRPSIIDLGMGYEIGIAGVRLSSVQRQKLAIARALIKSPDLLVLNEATSLFDSNTEAALLASIREAQSERSVLFVNGEATNGEFDQILRMEGGRIVARGTAGVAVEAEQAAQVPAAPPAGTDTFGSEVDVLAAIPLFAGLDRSKLKLMTFASQRFRYDQGQVLFEQGAVGDEAFIIIDGQVSVILETLDGPKNIGTIGKGELFGELALLCNAPRSATIQAATDLVVLTLTKDVFLKLIAEDVNMSARITRAVADRLERTTRDLSEAAAVRDSITDLPDERLLADRLNFVDARRRRFDEISSAMFFDLGDLTDLGAIADEETRHAVLREVASRVRSSVREMDMVSRLGGTQFFILLQGTESPELRQSVADRIAAALADPVTVDGIDVAFKKRIEFVVRSIEDADLDKLKKALQNREGETVTAGTA